MIQFDDDDVDNDQAVSFVEEDDSGSMEVGKGYGMGSNLCIGGLGRGGYGGVGGVSSDTAVDVGRRRCGRPLQDVACRYDTVVWWRHCRLELWRLPRGSGG